MINKNSKINIDKYIDKYSEVFLTINEFELGTIPFDRKYIEIINIQKEFLKRIFNNDRMFDNIFNVLLIKKITEINIKKDKNYEFNTLSDMASIKNINKKNMTFKIKISKLVKQFLKNKKIEYGFIANTIIYNFIIDEVIYKINELIKNINKDTSDEFNLDLDSLLKKINK